MDEPEKPRKRLGFSVLKTDFQSDNWTIFSNMAFYTFKVHVYSSFNGVSAICNVLHQPDLEPQTKQRCKSYDEGAGPDNICKRLQYNPW